jgi:rod shape-determining protein MreC
LKSDFLCQLIFFDKNINVMQNDEIVTSQLSEIFPPGLPLGNIKEIIYKSNMQTITLQPKADLKHIDYVFVMLKEKNYIQ